MPDPRVQVLLDGEALSGSLLADLTRVEVRESDNDPTVAILRFKLQQSETGELLPIDDERFEPLARVAVEVGAPGGAPIRLIEGHVAWLRPHFETVESNGYVEVVVLDPAVLLDAEDRAVAWPGQTDSEVAEAIFGRYGIAAEVTDAAERHQEDRYLLVQRETDWRFLRRLARRNGFRVWFEPDGSGGNTGHFAPRPLDEEPQADLAMIQDGANLRWLDVQWRSAGHVRAAGAAIDPLAKKVVRTDGQAAASASGSADPAELVDSALGAAGGATASGWMVDPPATDAALRAAGTGAADDARFVLEARGELDPALYRGLLRARRPVLIKGVGKRLAGAWYVRAVRTSIVDGKLAQTFVAERNALGLLGTEGFGQSAEEVGAQ